MKVAQCERLPFYRRGLSEKIEKAIGSNPFPEAESEPKTPHLDFLASAPRNPDVLNNGVFYPHAPDSMGRSKLAANAAKSLGVSMIARNWRIVSKIMEMAKQCG